MRALRAVFLSVVIALVLTGQAWADTTINFDDLPVGTVVTNQYANDGGTGQGVVFGPLPGSDGSVASPTVKDAKGQAHSGNQVADINCPTCNEGLGYIPTTSGTFAVARSRVSVYVGYIGATAPTCDQNDNGSTCAVVTLLAYDSGGNQIAASQPVTVTRGAGVDSLLSVSTPTASIVGFEITTRDPTDNEKDVAIDDLTFDTPTTPAPPDFTLAAAAGDARVVQGASATDTIAINRISGSSGDIGLAASGLPPGVHAVFVPNPANATQSVLTLSADPNAAPIYGGDLPITITGTPQSTTAGTSSHSVTIDVGVLPAFGVAITGSTNVSLVPCTVTVPVELTRASSFAGPVSLSVTGLPGGVQATFSPAQATFPNSSLAQAVTLTLAASPSGQVGLPRTATIHATATPYSEEDTTFKVAGSCEPQFDPEVISMQITQGTQLPALPPRNPSNPGAPITYASIAQLAAPGSQQALAELAAYKSTVVRVYADLKYGPVGGLEVPAVLKGYGYDRSGNPVPLPGSPILPVSAPATLETGLSALDPDFLQDNYEGVYTFELPSSWEHGRIEVEADLMPSQSSSLAPPVNEATARAAGVPGLPSWVPCTTTACQTDNKFAISQIPFLYTFPVTIRPLAMIRTKPYDATLPDPASVFKWAQVVTPIPVVVEPYAGTIDIGSEIGADNSHGAATIALLTDVQNYVCDRGQPAHGWDVGIEHDDIRSAQTSGYCWDWDPFPVKEYDSLAFVDSPRPLTSVAHELFHLLGRPHASAACNAGVGITGTGTTPTETWPFDQHGFLQSVGLAPAPSGSNFPYAVIPVTANGPTGQWYDFMSYCANTNDGNPLGKDQNGNPENAWISVHNWNAVMNVFGYTASAARVTSRRAHPAAARTVASLQVTASVDPGGHTTIVDVKPVRAVPPGSASSSPFSLIATDASGHTRADVPMLATFGHVDGNPPIPVLTLQAVVPAAAVTSLAVAGSGATLATRRESAHAPTVTIPRLPVFGSANATVRWRASDRDRDALTIEVDYSGDGGRSWSPVWMGPNLGQALLPDRYLFRSKRARIRVLANDGFRTTTAVSRRFASPGAAPSVQILTPWTGGRQPNDAPLALTGQAFDDQDRMLTGRRLRWILGHRLLGTGARISVTGLPAGRRRIELLATDRAGRVGRASVLIRLKAARPLFLGLSGPRSVKRRARTVRLTVTSSLIATLVVRGTGRAAQKFRVGRRKRTVTVRISRGAKTLNLILSLSAGGLRSATRIVVTR